MMIKCDGSLRRIANELVDCKSVGKIVFGEDVVGEGTQNYKKTWSVLGLRLGTVCGRLENSILILIDTSERDGMSQASHSRQIIPMLPTMVCSRQRNPHPVIS